MTEQWQGEYVLQYLLSDFKLKILKTSELDPLKENTVQAVKVGSVVPVFFYYTRVEARKEAVLLGKLDARPSADTTLKYNKSFIGIKCGGEHFIINQTFTKALNLTERRKSEHDRKEQREVMNLGCIEEQRK